MFARTRSVPARMVSRSMSPSAKSSPSAVNRALSSATRVSPSSREPSSLIDFVNAFRYFGDDNRARTRSDDVRLEQFSLDGHDGGAVAAAGGAGVDGGAADGGCRVHGSAAASTPGEPAAEECDLGAVAGVLRSLRIEEQFA